MAKAVGCKVEDVNKELVLGFLKDINCLNDCDIIKYKKKGRAFLLDMVGMQTCFFWGLILSFVWFRFYM